MDAFHYANISSNSTVSECLYVYTGCLPAISKSISEISMIKIATGKFYLSFSGSEWQAQMYGNG